MLYIVRAALVVVLLRYRRHYVVALLNYRCHYLGIHEDYPYKSYLITLAA